MQVVIYAELGLQLSKAFAVISKTKQHFPGYSLKLQSLFYSGWAQRNMEIDACALKSGRTCAFYPRWARYRGAIHVFLWDLQIRQEGSEARFTETKYLCELWWTETAESYMPVIWASAQTERNSQNRKHWGSQHSSCDLFSKITVKKKHFQETVIVTEVHRPK